MGCYWSRYSEQQLQGGIHIGIATHVSKAQPLSDAEPFVRGTTRYHALAWGKSSSSQIEEQEALWLDYEYEETQVKLDITEIIMSELIFENVAEFTWIDAKKKLQNNN